ncbi:MAG: ABC transporter ATP-binding protein [Planctomycetota bacterium]|jgi:lipoprotein-releasing system ATP-binding protein
MAMLEATNLHKHYKLGRVKVPVLRGVGLSVDEGQWLCIYGKSGSGKSTLLHLLGGLDRPSDGEVLYEGRSLARMSQGSLDDYRCRHVGFVFQFYHLLPECSLLENVLCPLMIQHGRVGYLRKRSEFRARALEILDIVGLIDRASHRPAELSGGERQRTALARALIHEPDLLLADEPTGNLDQQTGAQILDVIEQVRGERRKTVVMVTHDESIATRADRIINLRDGVLDETPAVSTG